MQKELLEKCSALLTQASEALEKLKVLLPQVDSMDDVPAMAMAYHDQIVPAMAALRKPWTSWSCWWTRPSGPCPPMAT